MEAQKKIEMYIEKILAICYENINGGAYAYVQYMAHTRELLLLLRSFNKIERQLEVIEGISWLFNEHLTFKFTHRHKIIFDEKMNETRRIIEIIRKHISEANFTTASTPVHAKAA